MQRSLSLQIILPLVSFDSFPPHCTHPSINPVTLTWSHDNQCWSLAASLRPLCAALIIRYKICTHTFQRKGVAPHYRMPLFHTLSCTVCRARPLPSLSIVPSPAEVPLGTSPPQPFSLNVNVNPSTQGKGGKGSGGKEYEPFFYSTVSS